MNGVPGREPLNPPHNNSPIADELGANQYRLYLHSVMRTILSEARDGLLSRRWREDIESRNLPAAAQDGLHVRPLVIAALQGWPVAAWEPGQGSGWRAAADSWFCDSRAVLAELHAGTVARYLKSRALHMGIGTQMALRVGRSAEAVVQGIADRDVRIDERMVGPAEAMFIVDRDRLTASYLAALAAGGEQVDWRAWFERRIETWTDPRFQERDRIILRAENVTPYWQKLPDYWRG